MASIQHQWMPREVRKISTLPSVYGAEMRQRLEFPTLPAVFTCHQAGTQPKAVCVCVSTTILKFLIVLYLTTVYPRQTYTQPWKAVGKKWTLG